MKLKPVWKEVYSAFPALKKRTLPVLGGTIGITAPCCALLLIAFLLETAGSLRAWSAAGLISLLTGLAVMPLTAAMITYAAGASWEGRKVNLTDAYHLARIRIREIAITGLAAGAVVWLAGILTSLLYSLIGVVPALLGFIPVVGPIVTAAAACVIWLISTAVEFLAHTVLVMGMIALTADGITGRAQAERALAILRGGLNAVLSELALVFILWLAVQGVCALAAYLLPLGGALIFSIAEAAMTAVSMVALSAVYLRQRDRQDGARVHA